eukprot:7835537-Heterocapsa_arctica.AAC.1
MWRAADRQSPTSGPFVPRQEKSPTLSPASSSGEPLTTVEGWVSFCLRSLAIMRGWADKGALGFLPAPDD